MLLALGQIHFSPKSDHTPSLGWSRFPIRVEAAEGFFFCDFAGAGGFGGFESGEAAF